MELKKTSLYEKHIENKGKIIDFSGWALPLEYESVLKEAKAVRMACGMFDASHMGEILVEGKDALPFLQQLTSNDISLVKQGSQQYNLFLNENGGIIDDLMIYHRENSFLCVVNASNKNKVCSWLNYKRRGDVRISDSSDKTALISLQGPCSGEVMKSLAGEAVSDLEYMNFTEKELFGSSVIISRSGYTGEDGFEIYPSWDKACLWWDKLIDIGKSFGVSLCGLGSRDILRIEAGYPLYGHEIEEDINPYQASLGWVVKLKKNFIAREKLIRVKEEGVSRKRAGFVMQERAVPRQGYLVYFENKEIGRVSSGTYSPNLDKFIGMAHVDKEFSLVDTEIKIDVRGKLYKAMVVNFPFIKVNTKREVNCNS